jgi:hypothetical protein
MKPNITVSYEVDYEKAIVKIGKSPIEKAAPPLKGGAAWKVDGGFKRPGSAGASPSRKGHDDQSNL